MAALTAALLGATALSGVSQAMGQRREGQIAKQQGESESALFGMNANLADAQAADAIARGQQAVGRQQLATKQLTSEQRAAFAGQGVNVNDGSAAEVQAGDQMIGTLDELTLANNAMLEAHGYKTEASIYRYQGEMAKAAGRNRAAAANASAFNTLLTTGAQVANLYTATRSTTPKRAPRVASSSPSPSSSYGGYNSRTASR
jgi:hypothetical protein